MCSKSEDSAISVVGVVVVVRVAVVVRIPNIGAARRHKQKRTSETTVALSQSFIF